MANRYANLVGSNKIKDEWQKINTGFDLVQADMDEKADASDLAILQGTVTNHIGSGGNAHAEATDQQAGFMSATDKQKLDGIEEGAQVNQNAFARVNDVEASDPSDELTITGGTGITVTTNPNTKEVIVTATGSSTPGPHGSSHTEHGADPIPNATTTEGGLMSAADKTRLDGATSAATPNTIVQRDSAGRFKAAAPSASDDVARKAEVDAMLPKSGGEMTGHIILPNNIAIYGKDTGGTAQTIVFVGINNNVTLGDPDLETNIRGTNVKINGYTAWHAGNLPYETGNWTPQLRFGGSTSGITYAFRAGRYTRIANVVYWSFEIMLSSKGSASGTAAITGLPFSDAYGLNCHAVGLASNISVPSGQWLVSHIVATTVSLMTNTGSPLTSAEFSNNSVIVASGFYFI